MSMHPNTIQLSDLLEEQMENQLNDTHISLEILAPSMAKWTIHEFEQRLECIASKFSVEDFQWLKEHLDPKDLLTVSHPGELVHLLQFLWSNSSFEEEVDLLTIYEGILRLTTDDLLILCWYISQ